LGIEFPIIQAGMGAFTSAELAAAVSNAGDLVQRVHAVGSLVMQ
jgi:NAD(P)H-dependent flavin oxidoreductase YrpB (nitropropane dioxygenase family)